MDVDLRQLRAFLAVADELHFGRAASRLRLAQPALSQQIRRTERDLGVDLFVRTSRSVALTPAGHVLQGRARSLLDQVERDLDEVVRVGRGEAGRLDVGFVVSALPLGPIERVQAFRQRYPLVRVELSEGYSSTLLARIVRGELDLAVLRDPDPTPAVRFRPFRSEPFVAAVPRGHRLADRKAIRGAELVDDPFVFFPAVAGSVATERNLAPVVVEGRRPRVVQEATTWATVLHLVGAGLGVTVAPESATLAAPDTVVLLPLRDDPHRSELVWAVRADDDREILRNFIAATEP
ncbi:LysR family transcriptional regulator [Curtobacterium citreum]|uniref:LysR substrate-binding domain-containing protein n=1 Tax=Curtobacterium citreum TaxID=2036 RepID=A0ABT2HEY6_9MICO|nr:MULTISPECIES: LysR substrate-binding domain-containing protein [Curtobacterium]KTR19361.1 LysR family transcriptional regulator [Curtobacterium citreum]MCS6521806.1 LysR substrate-binding domain-containing protein [Curtobacterium citreum]RDI02271.1 DNA-binding transcriptional LysR family regulator [Curtobacterium sp. AG1037]TQJ27196.1 DNA-binding transcriptional LysR family regulator [Curtobacterium citreum]GGL73306.1 LysR family transcriptional regulator [Curtobacterium citreum]